ncbi:hypothetical protein KSS87_011834 [Heliosperma pusillum]|nr:hypothetical protein KSS87_011834 [Heliosperma pusillum]
MIGHLLVSAPIVTVKVDCGGLTNRCRRNNIDGGANFDHKAGDDVISEMEVIVFWISEIGDAKLCVGS